MGRIPFRFAFPAASLALAAFLLFLPGWQAAAERQTGTIGWDKSVIDFVSPPVATEIVMAMYLPATIVVAPILISGQYLTQIYPVYGKQIEISAEVIVALAGFLQWYWIGRLLERQMGYRPASFNRAPSKWRRILNSIGIATAAALGLLGVFIALQPGTLTTALTSVVCCCFFIFGLVRLRRAQANPAPETTDLRLR